VKVGLFLTNLIEVDEVKELFRHAVARVPSLGAIPSVRRTSVSMMQRLVDNCPFRKLRLVYVDFFLHCQE
jgi:hypothetical protein